MQNKKDSHIAYPEWLIKTLVQFNRHTTIENEWELIDIAVDLYRQPDLPQRLDVFFTSLRGGFGDDVLVAGNFLTLGYYDNAAKKQVYPNFFELGRGGRSLRRLEDREDDEAAVYAYKEVKASIAPADRSKALIIQIPYFVRKAEKYSQRNGDISFGEFQQKFDCGEVLFTTIQQVNSEDEVERWVRAQKAGYEQRFIFTLGLVAKNGILESLADRETSSALSYLTGAFLSWAGMGVMDSTRYIMAAVAVKLAHYSHEFLKPFGKLTSYMKNPPEPIDPELKQILNEVVARVQPMDISSAAQFGSGAGSQGQAGPLGYFFNQLLASALVKNTTFEEGRKVENTTYPLSLKIEDQLNERVDITFENLPDERARIQFEVGYFERLMRNMLRNVAQHTGVKPARIKVKMELDTESKMLTMDFAHLGSSISRKIRKQLFRLPIRHAENGRTGIGLWTIGMAFEAQHLSVPQVIQSEDGVHFVFRFPVV